MNQKYRRTSLLPGVLVPLLFILVAAVVPAQQSPTSPGSRLRGGLGDILGGTNNGQNPSGGRQQPGGQTTNDPLQRFNHKGGKGTQKGTKDATPGNGKPGDTKPDDNAADTSKDKKSGPHTVSGGAPAAGQTPAAGAKGPAAPGAGNPALAAAAAAAAASQKGGKGGKGGVTVTGNQEAFEPTLLRKVEYSDVPEVGEPLTLTGPMTVQQFLEAINMATNWNVVVTEAAQAVQLQFWISEAKPKKALEILRFHDIYYDYNADTQYLYVMTKDEYLRRHFGDTKPQEFTIKNADVPYIETVITPLLSGDGRIVSDQRTGHIYLWDRPDNLEQITKMVKDLDVPLNKAEFTIKNADLADIETVLNSLLSPNGNLISDVRTAQIFVWDSPAVLSKMKQTVARLDVPVESRTFEVKYVSAEDMVDTLEPLLSERGLIQVDPRYNSLVITDLPGRMEKMERMITTLDRQLETRTWVIKYADLDFIADQLDTIIPDEMGDIVTNDDTHQITVTGLPSRLDQVDELIKTWDIKRKQVLIESYIVEVTNDIERQFNINWSYFGSHGQAPVTVNGNTGFNPATAGSASLSVGQLPYTVPLYGALQLDASGKITRPIINNTAGKPVTASVQGNPLAIQLDYLDKQNKATILASPRVTVQDGEEATFENATRVPYVSASTEFSGGIIATNNTVNNNLNNTNRVDFIDVGTILAVLPRISDDDNIVLDISAEDSTFIDKAIVSNGQTSTVPQKTVRRAETQLRMHTGETVVLGGLRRDQAMNNTNRTPLLGDLPLVGRLFRYPDKQATTASLLIFITTTIVDEYTHPESYALTNAEEEIADSVRHNSKDLWGRLNDRFSKGANEINVSIGQTGSLHSEGKRVTIEELQQAFAKIKDPALHKIVIRRHPRAPIAVVNQLTETAMEANLKIEFDDNLVPLVPSDAKAPAETVLLPNETKKNYTVNVAPDPGPKPAPESPATEPEKSIPDQQK